VSTERRGGDDRRQEERRDTAPLWFKLDALWDEDPLVEELGAEFGASGLVMWVMLLGRAKLQELLHDRRGTVALGWRGLTRAAKFDDVDQARAAITLAVDLELIEIVEDGRFELTVFIPNFARKQAVPSMTAEAQRKRAGRAQQVRGARVPPPDASGRDGTCPDTSGHVRPRPAEGEVEVEGDNGVGVERAPAPDNGLHPSLPQVLAVLEPTGLLVEPMSIDSLLRAFPDEDHLSVAHAVAALQSAGHVRTVHATSIFKHELEKARDRRLRALRPAPARAGPRRPVDTDLEERRARGLAALGRLQGGTPA